MRLSYPGYSLLFGLFVRGSIIGVFAANVHSHDGAPVFADERRLLLLDQHGRRPVGNEARQPAITRSDAISRRLRDRLVRGGARRQRQLRLVD